MKIRWTHPTESGLCDRLYDLLFLATYARVRKAKLYTAWAAFKIKSIDAAHRSQDILLHNVVDHIQFPPEIVFDDNSPCDTTFGHGIGAAANMETLHALHASSFCTYSEFKEVYATVRRDFKFCAAINTYLDTLPARFVSLHIRRSDKVRPNEHDGCYIRTDELDHINELTFKAINAYGHYYDTFFVCGDEDEKTQPFIDYARSKGFTVFTVPPMEKWKSTYYDIATMTRSDHVVTSQRFSTFSLFPSLIGKGECLTVYELERRGLLI